MNFINLMNQGGPINWLLCAIFCLCCCQVIERIIYFIQIHHGSAKDPLIRLQLKAKSLREKNTDTELYEKELQKEAARLVHEMERGLWHLSFVGSIAPSLGLLGTVTGLISCFKDISGAANGLDIQTFSGGIWEAMLTTATGMVIAIPAMFSYRIFTRLIEKRTTELSLYGEDEVGSNDKTSAK